MSVLFFYLFGTFLEYCKGHETANILNNGHGCRDSENERVAWWYIYKPPTDALEPFTGAKYCYLTPDTSGWWIQSSGDITDGYHNMLNYTMTPVYKKSHRNEKFRAVLVFEPGHGSRGRTSARGVVMAEPGGGFLLMHTVPGFPVNIDSANPLFPVEELQNGHLLTCVSLDINDLNKVGNALKEIEANITYKNLPGPISVILRKWNFRTPSTINRKLPWMYYLMRSNESGFDGVAAALVARSPGVKNCIYASFAARQLIMMNVYGQSRSTYLTTVCGKGFGVRNLDSLCMKVQGTEGNSVFYVTNSTDHSWFAVSTAAHWQQQGSGPRQFWVCTSSVDKEDLGEGGLLLCLQNYELWVAFDNLKVAEPSCD